MSICCKKKTRYSEKIKFSYHNDNFVMRDLNFYTIPELATRGVLPMNQFYDFNGTKKYNEDLELPYPDLSKFPIYKQNHKFSKKLYIRYEI